MTRIIIGGDICPTESNYAMFENGDTKALIGEELENIFNSADYCFLNLEAALTEEQTPIKKAGPNLKAPTYCINGLKKINPYLYGLANNHILDYGQNGLRSTVDIIRENNISFTGVGNDLADANKGSIVQINNLKVGFYCCAEHEFTIASDDRPGVNPFDPLYSLDKIVELSKECDYCIVAYHGGKEYYRYPSPRLQKICRKIAEKGANLIICQHSHCVGSKEEWGNSTIIYGQGNFLFDRGNDEYWSTSLLLELLFEDNNVILNYIPLRKNGNGVRLDKEKGDETLAGFFDRSKKILEPGFVEKEYSLFADKTGNLAIYSLLYQNNFFEKVLNKLSGNRRREKYKCKDELTLLNFMECEAWNELCIKAMRNNIE